MEWRLGVPDAKADLDGELNGELSHEQKLPRGSSSYMAWLSGLGTGTSLQSGWRLLICPRKARASQCRHLAA